MHGSSHHSILLPARIETLRSPRHTSYGAHVRGEGLQWVSNRRTVLSKDPDTLRRLLIIRTDIVWVAA